MRAFNVKEALGGKPVKLRNGYRAFVRYQEEEFWSEHPLMGICVNDMGAGVSLRWTKSGEHRKGEVHDFDIIGMWMESFEVGGVVVPDPAREPLGYGQRYWIVNPTNNLPEYSEKLWRGDPHDYKCLERGLIQTSKYGWRKHVEAIIKASGGEWNKIPSTPHSRGIM